MNKSQSSYFLVHLVHTLNLNTPPPLFSSIRRCEKKRKTDTAAGWCQTAALPPMLKHSSIGSAAKMVPPVIPRAQKAFVLHLFSHFHCLSRKYSIKVLYIRNKEVLRWEKRKERHTCGLKMDCNIVSDLIY